MPIDEIGSYMYNHDMLVHLHIFLGSCTTAILLPLMLGSLKPLHMVTQVQLTKTGGSRLYNSENENEINRTLEC